MAQWLAHPHGERRFRVRLPSLTFTTTDSMLTQAFGNWPELVAPFGAAYSVDTPTWKDEKTGLWSLVV